MFYFVFISQSVFSPFIFHFPINFLEKFVQEVEREEKLTDFAGFLRSGPTKEIHGFEAPDLKNMINGIKNKKEITALIPSLIKHIKIHNETLSFNPQAIQKNREKCRNLIREPHEFDEIDKVLEVANRLESEKINKVNNLIEKERKITQETEELLKLLERNRVEHQDTREKLRKERKELEAKRQDVVRLESRKQKKLAVIHEIIDDSCRSFISIEQIKRSISEVKGDREALMEIHAGFSYVEDSESVFETARRMLRQQGKEREEMMLVELVKKRREEIKRGKNI